MNVKKRVYLTIDIAIISILLVLSLAINVSAQMNNYVLDGKKYPNPFNPVTRINYALPEAGHTRIVIYDLIGREVTRLVDGNISAGYHSVNWNASNVASGIYFYRLTSGDFVSTKKMVLLK